MFKDMLVFLELSQLLMDNILIADNFNMVNIPNKVR